MILTVTFLMFAFDFCAAYPINTNINGLTENDIMVDNNRGSTGILNAILQNAGKWPSGVVPYEFSYDFNDDLIPTVKREMAKMESSTCIKFLPKTYETDYVRFIQDGTGSCYSNVGKVGGEQVISLPDWCVNDKDGVLHELMHALGFTHEQNRHDRDEYITIHWANIPATPDNVNWKKREQWELTYYGTDYDYTSVMHYPEFSQNGRIITPKRIGSIESDGLSWKDIHRIKKHYQCSTTDDSGTDDSGTDNTGTDDSGTDNTDVDDSGTDTVQPTCMNDYYYCGSELTKKGYHNVLSSDHLYQCKNNKAIFYSKCEDGCVAHGNSYCACEIGAYYCGFELFFDMNWPAEYDNPDGGHNLYECTETDRVSKRETCYGHCVRARNSYCDSGPFNTCTVGSLYCGREFGARKFTNAKHNALYKCDRKSWYDDAVEGKYMEHCDNGCIISNPDSFCSLISNVAY